MEYVVSERVISPYFFKRDGTLYTEYTKEEIYKFIKNNHPKTFIKLLEEMDYPWVRDQWECYCYTYGYASKVFGRYIAWCNLKAIKPFGYKDSALFYIYKITKKEDYDDCILC